MGAYEPKDGQIDISMRDPSPWNGPPGLKGWRLYGPRTTLGPTNRGDAVEGSFADTSQWIEVTAGIRVVAGLVGSAVEGILADLLTTAS
jgi:hypothetical protein